MNILVTGATGFVGRRLKQQFPGAVAAPSLRSAGLEKIRALIDAVQPEVILHTAAISDIGACDADPEGSYRANVVLPELLAQCAGGIKLIAFSSDQVYSGSEEPGPYREADACPGNRYARQKLEMEQRVLDANPDAVLLRAQWMYDGVSHKGNYYLNVTRGEGPLQFSRGQYRGIAYLREVTESMERVMALPGGAYNFGSETERNMYDLTVDYLRWLGRERAVEDCPPRHNLWMDCSKAGALGFSTVEEALRRCARDYGLK